MASPPVLAFDTEGRPVKFDTWLDDLHLFLQLTAKEDISLFDHALGHATAPAATADSTARSQWQTRDAHARFAIRNSLPIDEREHFGQHKTAQALYTAVVARYSSPASAALGRLSLPYLFPDLALFHTVADLITHLRTSEARFRAAMPDEFLAKNPPPLWLTLYHLFTRLPDTLRSVRDHFLARCPTELTIALLEKELLAAEASIVAVGASRGDPRTPFFEGCSPSPLLPSVASATAVDLLSTERVGTASASSGRRSGKGKGGKGGGGDSGGGGGGGGGGESSLPSHPRLLLPVFPVSRGGSIAPHSSSFPPTTAPLQTLHMDVWGPARVRGQGQERYFLIVVDDYSRYTTVFPLRTKGEVPDVLIPWIRSARLQLSERFHSDFPVLRLHSDRGGEFSSDLLAAYCAEHGIEQSFTLPAYPQQNGVAERRIGLVMEVARTSLIHAAAPHFLWPFAVRYAAHQLNLWPRVSLPETSPTLLWMGEVGDASRLRVWGSRAFVRDTSADKLSSRAVPCVFLGFVPDAPGWQFYHATSLSKLPHIHPPQRQLQQWETEEEEEQGTPLTRHPPITTPQTLKQGREEGGGRRRQEGPTQTAPTVAPPVACRGDPGGGGPQMDRGSRGRGRSGPGQGQDVTFDESVPYYRLFPYRTAPLPPPPLFLAPGAAVVDPLPPHGAAPSGVSQVDPVEPVEVAVDSRPAWGAEPGGAEPGGAEPGGAESGGAEPGGVEPGGAEPGGAEPGGTEPGGAEPRSPESGGSEFGGCVPESPTPGGALSSEQLREWYLQYCSLRRGTSGARCTTGAGASASPPSRELPSREQIREWYERRCTLRSGAPGVTDPGAAGAAAGAAHPGIGAAAGTDDPGVGAAAGAEDPGAGAATGAVEPGVGAAAGTEDPGVGAATGAEDPRAGAAAGAVESGVGAAAGAGDPGVGAATGAEDPGVGAAAGAEDPGTSDSAGSGVTARRRPYFVPLLQQVLGLPPSPGLPPPSACPQPVQSQLELRPASPLPAPSPYTVPTRGLAERREPASRPASPVRTARTSGCGSRQRPPPVPGTHRMSLRLSTAPLRAPLPSPPESSLPALSDPESDSLRAASPTVTRLLATVFTDPSFESTAASALVAELVDFAARCRLDYAASLVTKSEYVCPPSVGGACALGTDVLEDRQEEFQCLAAASPHLVSVLLTPEGSSCRHEHMAAAKRVLRYLCSTSGMGLVLGGRSPVVLTGHADASWADDQATQRSSQGYTFSLGSGSVSWRATRSSSVLGSSCEAEIYAGAMAAQELRWLTYLLTDLGEPPRSPPVLFVDNKAMLDLCREQRLEHRTKHIALRYFLARELQQRGQLRLAYVASEANTADVFTKALAPCDHQRFCTQLGLVPVLPHLLTS
ncbi:unnamed protein product [Closterium sp. NIES-53]